MYYNTYILCSNYKYEVRLLNNATDAATEEIRMRKTSGNRHLCSIKPSLSNAALLASVNKSI